MKDTTKIRHINARKILIEHCSNSIKLFADKIGRSEQQCSNLLREKTNVRIGDKIARVIEKTFGYPDGWLDMDNQGVDEILTIEGIKMVSMFNDLSECIDQIKTFTLEQHSLLNQSRFCNKLSNKISVLLKISRHAKQDFMEGISEKLELLLLNLGQNVTYDQDVSAFASKDSIFILSDIFTQLTSRTAYLKNLRRSKLYGNEYKIYDVTPFVSIDNSINFVIEETFYFDHRPRDKDKDKEELIKMIRRGEDIDLDLLSDDLRSKINNMPEVKTKS